MARAVLANKPLNAEETAEARCKAPQAGRSSPAVVGPAGALNVEFEVSLLAGELHRCVVAHQPEWPPW